MSFTQVVVGNPTAANDVNQMLSWLNGSSNNQATLTNGTATPLIGQFSSAPGSDTALFQGQVSADAAGRLAAYIRGSDGYGGFQAGAGSSFTAHWYAQSSGWKTPESVLIVGGLTVQGSTSLAGIVSTGNLSLDSGAITSDGSGNVTATSFKGKLQTNRNGTNQVNTIFTGTTTPSSPAVGDIWIQA